MTTDKQSHLARARALLAAPTYPSVQYAALECRMVMEIITYEKLRAASDIIPHEVLATWQAHTAVKRLLEFEDLADSSFEVSVGDAKIDGAWPDQWVSLGVHHALSAKWLSKNYNKVGRLLHPPMPSQTVDFDPDSEAAYLVGVVAELEKAVASGIVTMTRRIGCTFKCGRCDTLVVRSREAMKAGKTAKCFAVGCGAEYRLVTGDDGAELFKVLTEPFQCPSCLHVTEKPADLLRPGIRFRCGGCEKSFGLLGKVWHCAMLD